ncbi:hypothetical protein BS17DRAFT_778218 [Gyrodon lividus]|nr:hypothetical protein BS17DRAFT_778218 [Gyrodon lividus]
MISPFQVILTPDLQAAAAPAYPKTELHHRCGSTQVPYSAIVSAPLPHYPVTYST